MFTDIFTAPSLHSVANMVAEDAFNASLDACEGDHHAGDRRDEAFDHLHQSCDGLDLVIYHHKAIACCAAWDTSEGEAWLEDAGGIAQPGDTFGAIASRITYATILCAAQDRLNEIIMSAEADGNEQEQEEG